MAEKTPVKVIGATSFRRVKKSFNAAGGARRGEPKMTTTRTGLIRSNAAGKDLTLDWIKQQGGDPNNFQLAFGGNEEKGQLALYVPIPEDTGLMKVAIYKNSISFHAGAAFQESPKLRPVTTVDCHVEATVDAEGVPCLVIQIHGASPTRTVKRKKDDSATTKS